MKTFLLALVSCAAACFVPETLATGPAWKAGLASSKITPQKPAMMAGYANRIKPHERVVLDIYAKALVLEDAAGQRGLILTCDLIGMPLWFAEPLAERIGQKTGLRREQILLTWSHNHAGPSLSLNEAPGPGVAPIDAKNRVAYTQWLQDQLVELAARANTTLEPVTMSHGRGVAKFVMNRREFTPKGIILGVNPAGPVDRSVPVLRIDAIDGTPRAVLFGLAAHNTTLGSRNFDLCGDYAGFAQHLFEERHPGVQAMFMMGCGGDANPYPRDTLDTARAHGAELAHEVSRVFETKLRPVSGPLNVAFGKAQLPLLPATKEELRLIAAKSPGWQAGNATRMLAMLERGETLPAHYAVPVAVWQFGSDLTMVALSGEVVVDYVHLIEKAIGPLDLWVAAYANEGYGYLPSARVAEEGGYETRGLSSGEGWFAPEAQDAVVAKVKELATQVRRPGTFGPATATQ